MDGWTFASKVIEEFVKLITGLAWPVVVGVLVLTQGKALSGLLPRTKKFKGFGVDAEFEQALDKAEVKLEANLKVQSTATGTLTVAPRVEHPIENVEETDELLAERFGKADLSDRFQHPLITIESAWNAISGALHELMVKERHIDADSTLDDRELFRQVHNAGVLPSDVVESIRDLYQARILATEHKEFAPDVEQARRYLSNANQALYAIMFSTRSPVQGS